MYCCGFEFFVTEVFVLGVFAAAFRLMLVQCSCSGFCGLFRFCVGVLNGGYVC